MNTSKLKKPRLRKYKLSDLQEPQRNQLIDWLLAGMACKDALVKMQKELKVKVESVTAVERFWKIEGKAVMRWQQLRPPHVSPIGWEISRRDAVKEVENPGTSFERRRAFLIFLETGSHQKRAAAPSRQSDPENSAANNPDPLEEENPLDDQDKLDEIRRQVFGSAP